MTRTVRRGWHRLAACAGVDWEQFFPRAGAHRPSDNNRRDRLAVARTYCADCPVIADCAAEADRCGDLGIRGGSLRVRMNNSASRAAYRVTRLVPNAPPPPPPCPVVDDWTDPPGVRRAG